MDRTSTIHKPVWQITQSLVIAALFLISGIAYGVEHVTYFHNDQLGSPVVATDSSGNVVWHESYQPYGNRDLHEGDNQNSLWFTGKQEEATFGISNFGARWYDPDLGRFLSIDPVGASPANPESFNRYAYANNNPYRFVDPDGNESLDEVNANLNQGLHRWRGGDGRVYWMPYVPGYVPPPNPNERTITVLSLASGAGEIKLAFGWALRKILARQAASVAMSGADNIANAFKLAEQLRLQSARSPFKLGGQLTDDAIKNSREIIPASEINNPAVPEGFSKYSTETFQSPSGNFQAHFYKNPTTGEVYYGKDYKVIFNSKSGAK